MPCAYPMRGREEEKKKHLKANQRPITKVKPPRPISPQWRWLACDIWSNRHELIQNNTGPSTALKYPVCARTFSPPFYAKFCYGNVCGLQDINFFLFLPSFLFLFFSQPTATETHTQPLMFDQWKRRGLACMMHAIVPSAYRTYGTTVEPTLRTVGSCEPGCLPTTCSYLLKGHANERTKRKFLKSYTFYPINQWRDLTLQ